MIKKTIGALAFTMLFAAQAQAATMSFVGPTDVRAGDSFQLQIFGDFDPAGLFAGGITLLWDASLVELTNVALNLNVDTSFSCPGAAGCPPATADSAPIVWGQFSVPLVAAVAGEVLMATLDFQTTIGALGVAAFSMIDNPALTGGWFDATFSQIDAPAFLDANVNIVPLPAAVWFMIGGLGTLLGFRRK